MLKRKLIVSSRLTKQLIAGSVDFLSILSGCLLSIYVTSVNPNELIDGQGVLLIFVPIILVSFFYFSGIYRSIIRYIDFSSIYQLLRVILLAYLFCILALVAIDNLLGNLNIFNKAIFLLPIKTWLVSFLISFFLILSSRMTALYYFSDKVSATKVVIYGAGSAGIQLANALSVSSEMEPVAFIDGNPALQNTFLGKIKVLAPSKLEKLYRKGKVDEVLIAMPSASKVTLRNLLKEIENFSIKVRILPGLAELAQGKISVSELKEVDITDLLGRYEVEANQDLINRNIKNKVVLITGAGGSIGSEISRQVVKNDVRKVILLDANEYALYSIKHEIEASNIGAEIFAVLASVNNKKRITEICKTFRVDTIYHTAAYKHVSLVEENPFEAVFNNIQGTKICAEAAVQAEVETFVLISTDKAVRPTNIMGATKRFSELVLQSLSLEAQTRMIMVRFGNVIGSSGSAIPLFQEQIRSGGPVTVTHPEVIRYFMSIPEAAELVIQAGAMGKGGDVFVLDMGEPVKIYDLAKRLIHLSGLEIKDEENPDGDIEIIFTGLRPGEKLYEELLIGDNVSNTEHSQILRAEEDFLKSDDLENFLELLREADRKGDVVALRNILKQAVSGFTPAEEIVDVVYQQKN